MQIESLPPRMQAAVYHRYGTPDVVRLCDVPVPSPGPGELLVRVRAATVSAADARLRSATFPPGFALPARLAFGLRKPRKQVLGADLCGEVVALGPGVEGFRIGDVVVAALGGAFGAHAQYARVAGNGAVIHKPEGIDQVTAAALVFGGVTALHFLDRAQLRTGERVLVNGASGCVGSAVVQLARQRGAHVTGVCSRGNFETVLALGAERCVDHALEDFTASAEQYDVIVDTVGNAGYGRCRTRLAPGGRLLLMAAGLGQTLGAVMAGRRGGHRLIAGVAVDTRDSLQRLSELVQSGEFVPLIDSIHPFAQIRQAHARVDSGRKRGSVVLRMP